jgi:REP element-mobilizing transposase RayT
MFEIFGGQSEGRKQFHYNLEYYFIRCGRRRNPRIYADTLEKIFDGLKQVNECGMVGIKGFGRLV